MVISTSAAFPCSCTPLCPSISTVDASASIINAPAVVFQVEAAPAVISSFAAAATAIWLDPSQFMKLLSLPAKVSFFDAPTRLTLAVGSKLMSPPDPTVRFVPVPERYSPPSTNCNFIPEAIVTTPECAVVPVTVKLSFTVVSDVVCPIDTGLPEVAVLIVIPLLVFVLSNANDVVAFTSTTAVAKSISPSATIARVPSLL